ncbi:glycogen synthase [Patescibacteria group bacterium]|nr:glycogen synthase [Patescibacteria group bacterium]
MKVLFAVWELDPFFKFGGLGDVARSLPGALLASGVDIRIVMPFYKVLKLGTAKKKKAAEFTVRYGDKDELVEIYLTAHPVTHVPVYLLRNRKYLFIAKSEDTFAFLDKAIVEMVKKNVVGFVPDIVHCNDHHTGLIPVLIKEEKLKIGTILTIHNLSYQGEAEVEILDKIGLARSKSKVLEWEIKSRRLNFLMEGIIHADVVTTVSPTYAREIMTEEFGAGLEDVLRGKEGRVFGILNGIDLDYSTDMNNRILEIRRKDARVKSVEDKHKIEKDLEKEKRLHKLFLQKKLHLTVDPDIPLFSFIGRFDPGQKGIDILHKMLRRIDLEKYEFVVLGSGNHDWEERFQWLCTFFPKNVSCNFVFDDVLAHQMYAASDFMLLPSLFEPCGLVQMLAMFCGTLPIAHKTGGLKDSIKDDRNGFLFESYSSESLERTVKKAVDIWHHDKLRYRKMVEDAVASDFSWNKSAKEYIGLYQKLVAGEL